MLALYVWLKNWLSEEKGQDLIEYALLIVLVALVVALALPTVTTALSGVYNRIATTLGS